MSSTYQQESQLRQREFEHIIREFKLREGRIFDAQALYDEHIRTLLKRMRWLSFLAKEEEIGTISGSIVKEWATLEVFQTTKYCTISFDLDPQGRPRIVIRHASDKEYLRKLLKVLLGDVQVIV